MRVSLRENDLNEFAARPLTLRAVNVTATQVTDYIQSAKETFEIEERAIRETRSQLSDNEFVKACELLLATTGRVVVTGIGKSGHIARKIASTLSSTGTPAIFLHPAEAAHGDMGMVRRDDAVLVLSKSGESDELSNILPALQEIGVPIIAITAVRQSRLAMAAQRSDGAVLEIRVNEEACPHDLAPTASTTASLVLGDALAIALLKARSFSSDDFAKLHPAGALGRKLTLAVRDLMTHEYPKVLPDANLSEVMLEMSSKRFGATSVIEQDGTLCGIITDGDLRRYFQSHEEIHAHQVRAQEIMTANPKTIPEHLRAFEALEIMENGAPKVMQLLVVDAEDKLCGIIHLHDIVKAGIS